MLGRDQVGQVGGCTALSHLLPSCSVSPWAGFGHSKSWLAACHSEGHPHPWLSRAPICSSSHLSLMERAALHPLQENASHQVSLFLPRISCQMASRCYWVLSLGGSPEWLPSKV